MRSVPIVIWEAFMVSGHHQRRIYILTATMHYEGDRASALKRFEENYKKLPERIKRRLVLENDELGYSVSDLLPVCQKLNIPLVLDWHHHSINPGSVEDLPALVPVINETWKRKGMKPKQHYSESRPGAVSAIERRAHSDRVMVHSHFRLISYLDTHDFISYIESSSFNG
jgi:UV damage endonuclease UvdE